MKGESALTTYRVCVNAGGHGQELLSSPDDQQLESNLLATMNCQAALPCQPHNLHMSAPAQAKSTNPVRSDSLHKVYCTPDGSLLVDAVHEGSPPPELPNQHSTASTASVDAADICAFAQIAHAKERSPVSRKAKNDKTSTFRSGKQERTVIVVCAWNTGVDANAVDAQQSCD